MTTPTLDAGEQLGGGLRVAERLERRSALPKREILITAYKDATGGLGSCI